MADEPQIAEPPVTVSTEDVQAQPRKSGRSRVDLILALTAIFFSGVSLYVAIENAHTQREMVAASTWPFVTGWVKIGGNEHGDLQFGVGNSGVGPAKIHSFEVFYKDRPVTSARDLLRQCCGLPADRKAADAMLLPWMSSTVVNEIVLRAGEDQPAFVLRPDPAAPELGRRLAGAMLELSFRGCYCSTLDECWDSALGSMQPTPVKVCREPSHPFVADGP
jgi:hypothetical protein